MHVRREIKPINKSKMNTQKNTDKVIWRQPSTAPLPSSIHVTAQGTIGINVGGLVRVMPIEDWHRLAEPVEAIEVGSPLRPSRWRRFLLSLGFNLA